MGTFFDKIVSMVGRRADDEALVAFVSDELGKKVPQTIGVDGDMKHVVAKKQGLELGFSNDVLHHGYPPIYKTKRSLIPYLQIAWLRDKLGDALPFGLSFAMSVEEIGEALGEPDDEWRVGERVTPIWRRPLDAARGVVFEAYGTQLTVQVDAARELHRTHDDRRDVIGGLLLSWLAARSLFDDEGLDDTQRELCEIVRGGKMTGSELMAEAFGRGLWDSHVENLRARDAIGLRAQLYRYCHNIGGEWIKKDLIALFGGREGPYGHQEPDLDDDGAEAVAKASARFDEQFKRWLS
ncbi:MAG: hypothetical protein KC503_00535 [Myxococcales bacterium]|nr:hypothetical protein [Myxococcales bacterium]